MEIVANGNVTMALLLFTIKYLVYIMQAKCSDECHVFQRSATDALSLLSLLRDLMGFNAFLMNRSIHFFKKSFECKITSAVYHHVPSLNTLSMVRSSL